MLSIIVLNYNRLQYTKQTVQYLIDRTTVEHEFIFVDNGSTDGTREYLIGLESSTNAKKVTYVFNPRNYGVAGGRNSGLKVATGDYLMTIDDDILVPANYDQMMIRALGLVDNLGSVGINVEGRDYPIAKINGAEIKIKAGNIGGGCICISRSTFEKVGYFSPDFVYGGEDCDLYNKLQLSGLRNGYIAVKGKHIDKRDNKAYEGLKRKAHKAGSIESSQTRVNRYRYKKFKKIYTPYKEPNIDTAKFDSAIKKPK